MRATAILAGAALLTAVLAPAAHAQQTGPELSVPEQRLDQSLDCSGDLAGGQTPILLVPGTATTPEQVFSWNYERAFAQAERPYCTVELPGAALVDIQVSAEYVVHALREMSRRTGGEVDVLGYSQGGMVPRWALKFWPGTRDIVDDMIGLDPSNYGTLDAVPLCVLPCQPAVHQQQFGSTFLDTLNEGPDTYAEVDYTVIYTVTDQVVFPNVEPAALSELRDGNGDTANIPVQRVCPVHVAEHLSMGTTDPVGYALALDAADRDGTAEAGRIDRSVCTDAVHPGVDPARAPQNFAELGASITGELAGGPRVLSEPELEPYAR